MASNGEESEFFYGIKNNASIVNATPTLIVSKNIDGTYEHATVADIPLSSASIAELALKAPINNPTFTGIINLQPNSINSQSKYIGQVITQNDYWRIYGDYAVIDQGIMVFEIGDNGTNIADDGQKYEFRYGAIGGGGVAKTPFTIDYNEITALANLNVTGTGTFSNNLAVGLTNSIFKIDFAGARGMLGYDNTYNATGAVFLDGGAGNNKPIILNPVSTGNVLVGSTNDNGSKFQVNGSATFASSVTANTLIASNTGDAIVTISGDKDNTAGEVGNAILKMLVDGATNGFQLTALNIGGANGDFEISPVNNSVIGSSYFKLNGTSGAATFSSSVTAGSLAGTGIRKVTVNSAGTLQASAGYKVYTVILNQSGLNAPIATILENTLSGVPAFAYVSAGQYTLTLANEFTTNKVFISATVGTAVGTADLTIRSSPSSTSQILIQSTSNAAFANGLITNSSFEIRVYS